ncbi:MAG: type IV pilus modification PilV family protein [Planctomycetota bacterium]
MTQRSRIATGCRGLPSSSPAVPDRARGFGLVEVLLTGLVLAITCVGLAAATVQAKRLSALPREDLLAWSAIHAVRSEISAVAFPDAAKSYHGKGFPIAGLTALRDDADGLPGEIAFAYGPGDDTRFYKVTLRARWRGTAGDRSIESCSYLANVRAEPGTPTPLENIVTDAAGAVTAILDSGPVGELLR